MPYIYSYTFFFKGNLNTFGNACPLEYYEPTIASLDGHIECKPNKSNQRDGKQEKKKKQSYSIDIFNIQMGRTEYWRMDSLLNVVHHENVHFFAIRCLAMYCIQYVFFFPVTALYFWGKNESEMRTGHIYRRTTTEKLHCP